MKSCVVGIVKNEGHGVFEWALYHAFLGFDAVIVYDNRSTDHTLDELERASLFADIRVIDWPHNPGQIQAYNDAISRFGSEFDTFCMLDADEFLVPLIHDGAKSLMRDLSKYPHVGIHWSMYGSSNHISRPQGLVTENYTMRSAKPNYHIKSVVTPKLFSESSAFINPHVIAPASYVGANGEYLEWNAKKTSGGKTARIAGADIARINHYYTKSREDYNLKISRGNADSIKPRDDFFIEKDRNDIADPIIGHRFPDVLARIRDAEVSW